MDWQTQRPQVFEDVELRWRQLCLGPEALAARHTAVERSYCRLELTRPHGRRLVGFFLGEEQGEEAEARARWRAG